MWTATNTNGTFTNFGPDVDYTCNNWTSNDLLESSIWGLATDASSNWSFWCSGGLCQWQSPIYCFEQ